ncbi:helix-turn-helix domain-containing protein [Nonomuraea salmonea]|uniref:helix-turn-helix domain-containing protein n=1 Tax=Nonomuraea salmonea TaxID=46181 RepID=UPI002FED1F63
MKVTQAYRYALDPTTEQAEGLASHCGAARFAFNWGLARVRAALAQRAAEQSYGISAESLTEVPWNLYALRRAWNLAKRTDAPWWAEKFQRGVQFRPGRVGACLAELVGFP